MLLGLCLFRLLCSAIPWLLLRPLVKSMEQPGGFFASGSIEISQGDCYIAGLNFRHAATSVRLLTPHSCVKLLLLWPSHSNISVISSWNLPPR